MWNTLSAEKNLNTLYWRKVFLPRIEKFQNYNILFIRKLIIYFQDRPHSMFTGYPAKRSNLNFVKQSNKRTEVSGFLDFSCLKPTNDILWLALYRFRVLLPFFSFFLISFFFFFFTQLVCYFSCKYTGT